MDLSHRFGQESGQETYIVSLGTVNVGTDFDNKDIVLTRVRSLGNIEPKVVENGRIDSNH